MGMIDVRAVAEQLRHAFDDSKTPQQSLDDLRCALLGLADVIERLDSAQQAAPSATEAGCPHGRPAHVDCDVCMCRGVWEGCDKPAATEAKGVCERCNGYRGVCTQGGGSEEPCRAPQHRGYRPCHDCAKPEPAAKCPERSPVGYPCERPAFHGGVHIDEARNRWKEQPEPAAEECLCMGGPADGWHHACPVHAVRHESEPAAEGAPERMQAYRQPDGSWSSMCGPDGVDQTAFVRADVADRLVMTCRDECLDLKAKLAEAERAQAETLRRYRHRGEMVNDLHHELASAHREAREMRDAAETELSNWQERYAIAREDVARLNAEIARLTAELESAKAQAKPAHLMQSTLDQAAAEVGAWPSGKLSPDVARAFESALATTCAECGTRVQYTVEGGEWSSNHGSTGCRCWDCGSMLCRRCSPKHYDEHRKKLEEDVIVAQAQNRETRKAFDLVGQDLTQAQQELESARREVERLKAMLPEADGDGSVHVVRSDLAHVRDAVRATFSHRAHAVDWAKQAPRVVESVPLAPTASATGDKREGT